LTIVQISNVLVTVYVLISAESYAESSVYRVESAVNRVETAVCGALVLGPFV